jgi:hypothetical protein
MLEALTLHWPLGGEEKSAAILTPVALLIKKSCREKKHNPPTKSGVS